MRNTYLCAQCMGKLNPLFEIAANQVMLDTAAELKKPVLSLGAQSEAVMDALDVLFGAY